MKTIRLISLAATTLLLSSCLTRIVTTAVAPEPTTVVYTQPSTRVVYGHSYVQPTTTTTVVKTSPSKTTTTVVQVTALNEDLSFFLDLRAVAAAFGEANSLKEFEMLLNSSNYMLSSLDLNRDGYVDYLRVVEAIEGYNHVIVIQAVLAQNIFQDVATLTVEMSYSTPYVQVIGAPYIYGPNYYVRPVYVRTPPMFAHFRGYGYHAWVSPYYWDYYPSYYHRPAPIYLSHYQAYVNTYITNHHYCNRCEYDDHVHYQDYSRTSSSVTRKDFETRHPEQSFNNRVASAQRNVQQSSGQSGASRTAQISNARDLQQRVAASSTTTTSTGSSRTATVSGNTGNTGSSRTSGTQTSGNTGSSRTSGTQTSGNTGSSRTSGTQTSGNTQSGSSRTATVSNQSDNSTKRVAPASTTTSSRVSTNGSSRTTTKTVNTDGSSTTTRRGATASPSRTSSNPSSSSSRTSGSTGSSRTSSSTSGSRTSGTSGSSRTSGTTTPRR